MNVWGYAFTSRAGTNVIVGRSWPVAKRVPLDQVDHARWDALLRKYVDRAGYVNYTTWKTSPQDVQRLDLYLASLSQGALKRSASRNAILAFWINAYNAVTVKGILHAYPIESIQDLRSTLGFGYDIWDDLLLIVGGTKFSLNQMEHEILRKIKEPRIHFAIVCASVGCPKLRNEAYTDDKMESQLSANGKAFFKDQTKFRYDPKEGRIHVSKILKWFGKDFGPTAADQMAAIAPYLPNESTKRFARSSAARVSYLDYDWSLNDQAKLR